MKKNFPFHNIFYYNDGGKTRIRIQKEKRNVLQFTRRYVLINLEVLIKQK